MNLSRKRVNVALKGWVGPVFPEEIEDLNTLFNAVGAFGKDLEQISLTIKGFVDMDKPITEDGYDWFWGLHFKVGQGKIAILFPKARDLRGKDGICLDRSITIYHKGKVNFLAISTIVRGIQQGLFKMLRKKRHLKILKNLQHPEIYLERGQDEKVSPPFFYSTKQVLTPSSTLRRAQ